MAFVPPHTHRFTIPTATPSEIEVGARDDAAITPFGLKGSGFDVEKLIDLPTNAELQVILSSKIPASDKGIANGVASLGGDSKVPASQLPSFATSTQGGKADSALQPAAIGTTVQAYDAGLQSISGLTTAADRMLYATGSDVYATTALTPFARSLLDDADQASAKVTLGVDPTTLDARYAQVAGPTADLGQSIGSSSRRYSTAYFANLQIGGNAQVNADLQINGAAGSNRQIRFRTAGLGVWTLLVNNTPQSGGDSGSNFSLDRISDAGAYLGTPIFIERANGKVTFETRPAVSGVGLVETQDRRGVASGYAPLDANGMVPSINLPVNGSYKGSWNANTNSPTITAGVGSNGDEYTVSVAGTNSITGTPTAWSVGDRAKFTTNGNKWERIPSVQAVNSVNGQTGIVVLAKSDVGLGNVDNTSDLNKPVSTAQQAALNLKAPADNPTFTGNVSIPAFNGGNYFAAGTGDGASFTTYNMKLRGHWGLAMETFDGSVLGYYDFRTGSWNVKGGYFLDGVPMASTASPALTGTPTAPTAALGTNTTQLATMAALKASADTKSAEFDLIDGGTF